MTISFLTIDDALQIHEHQITRYGGDTGIRDLGLLESALAMPQSGVGGECFHSFPAEMAKYLFHLVKNHPFVDGNKRIGLAAALTFLKLNDLTHLATQDEVQAMTLATACGELDKPAIAEFFRRHTTTIP